MPWFPLRVTQTEYELTPGNRLTIYRHSLSPYLGHLIAIDLHGNGAGGAITTDLADGRFPDLAELWLGANSINDAGAMALAHSPHLTKLRFLDLRGNHIVENTTRSALRRRFGSALKM